MMEYFSGEYYVIKDDDKNYMFYNHTAVHDDRSEERGDEFYNTFNMIYRDSEGKLQERIFEASAQLNDNKVVAFSCDTFHYLMIEMMNNPMKLGSVIRNLIFEKPKSITLDGFNPEMLKDECESDEVIQVTAHEQDGVIVTFKPISPVTRKD